MNFARNSALTASLCYCESHKDTKSVVVARKKRFVGVNLSVLKLELIPGSTPSVWKLALRQKPKQWRPHNS